MGNSPAWGHAVPAVIFASETLVREMDQKVYEQAVNVAKLPDIVKASYAMPDANWGYGFPIGGVAAFDPDLEMDAMLLGGARWAVENGWGFTEDLERIEESGQMLHAKPDEVSQQAKQRQRDEMGTLGSGNHYLEVQEVTAVFEPAIAQVFGLKIDGIVVMIHCGSRGLGHQIGTEFLKRMAMSAQQHGVHMPYRELACAPIDSDLGRTYLGAMRAAINCALANRQILTHLVRQVFADMLPQSVLSSTTCP